MALCDDVVGLGKSIQRQADGNGVAAILAHLLDVKRQYQGA